MANLSSLIIMAAGAAEHAGAHEAAEPAMFGTFSAAWIVAASMAVLIIIALVVKVPATLAKGLDDGIADIKKQLDEAKALRAEAEKLRADYAARIANAEKEALALVAHAKTEAEAIVAKAEADTTATIGRREKIASEKIEAAERAAVSELRAKAAFAAADAAKGLIAGHYGADADRVQVDAAIALI
jgi:F-type H+-transporting ATPase subunit b